MNEESQPPLKQSQNDWKKILRWSVILTGCLFGLILIPSLILAEIHELPGTVVGGLVFSMVLTTLGLAAVMFSAGCVAREISDVCSSVSPACSR